MIQDIALLVTGAFLGFLAGYIAATLDQMTGGPRGPKMLVLALLLAGASPAPAEEDEPLPLVCEAYDVVYVVHERSESRAWEVSRVFFLRRGRVIADRILCEDMLWSARGGAMQLEWNDYGNCYRVVEFGALTEVHVELDDAEGRGRDAGPWWGMARRMTDMAQPEK